MVGLSHLLHQSLLERVIHLRPSFHHLLVTVLVGDKTHLIVHRDLVNGIVTVLNNLLLLSRNDDIVKHERQTTFVCLAITEVLDTIEEFASTSHTHTLDDASDDLLQRLLTNDLIDEADLLWNHIVDDDTTNGGLHKMLVWIAILIDITNNTLDEGVHIHLTFVEGNNGFFWTIECKTFSLCTWTYL